MNDESNSIAPLPTRSCLVQQLAEQGCPTTSKLRFKLNGELVELDNPDPRQLLVHWLRQSGYPGTKYSCGQGGCGACTVNIRPWHTSPTDPAKLLAVNGCLCPLAAVHEMDVLTVEGLTSHSSAHWQLDPVQERIAIYNGSQCGWCTPGFVMGMNAYLDNTTHDQRTVADIENLFDGHLCRCTGFRPILCGMKTFAKCGNQDELSNTPPLKCVPSLSYTVKKKQHLHVPVSDNTTSILVSSKDDANWFGLRTIDQLWSTLWILQKDRRFVRLMTGNTAFGIQPVQPKIEMQMIMLYIGGIPQLTEVFVDDSCITARCSVPIQHLQDHMRHLVEAHKGEDARSTYPPSVAYNHWKRLATVEIRNVGSIGGNLYIARECEFPSDLALVLTTLGATVKIAGPEETMHSIREETMTIIDFLQGRDILDGTKIIYEITIPIVVQKNVFIRTHKVSLRPQNSHPVVNGGFSVKVEEDRFLNVCIVFGNIASKVCRMSSTEEWMEKNCMPTTLFRNMSSLLKQLENELQDAVVSNLVSSEQFRVDTARNLFYKYLLEMACVFKLPGWTDLKQLKSAPQSIVNHRFSVTSKGQQDFCVYPEQFPVSEPIINQSAFLLAMGEARFTQDIGLQDAHLNGVYILSIGPKALPYAKFCLDIPSNLKEMFPDVVRVFTANDLMEPQGKSEDTANSRNCIGVGQQGFPGDTLFAQEKVIYIGQPVGMVVAKSETAAREAAKWLQEHAITYIDLQGMVSLDEAIEKKRFFYDKTTCKSAPSRLLKVSRPSSSVIDWSTFEEDADVIIVEGSQRTGAQYHFYMETQSAIAYPTEGGGIKLYASTQEPDNVQGIVAHVCCLPSNQVTVEVVRVGGGYGGKCSQSKFTSAAAAFCAQQLQKPVRVENSREEDMHMIGKRHAYLGKYKVAVSKDGIIRAMQIHFYSDGGCSYDTTFPVMDISLLKSDNAYNVKNFLAQADCAMTNKVTSTTFRTFGVIQTVLIVEAAIEAVAEVLDIPDDQLREKNFYKVGDYTPYGQQLLYCNLDGVWSSIKKTSNYEARKKAVEEFNRSNRYKKRGIKLIPVKDGISLRRHSSNQGAASVSVYHHDGTVLISHGGVEMGQGLNTKMMQIAALELHVPVELIRVTSNSTEKIANPVFTAGSTSSDLYGGALKTACSKLRERLLEHLKQHDKPPWFQTHQDSDSDDHTPWIEVVQTAYDSRISLMSEGFFAFPGIVNITNDSPHGRAFYYFTYAAAVSEVEIDSLTGEFSILRSDIVYDAGHSLNPAIDVGQIEGAFVMGIGNVTTEEIVYDDNGRLLTDGTWEYKPPCSKTIPQDLRVTIYPGAKSKEELCPAHRIDHFKTDDIDNPVLIDPRGIQSSKATGEPPLVLANSVFFSIKQAVSKARKESGMTGNFTFDSPATVQRIQQACAVNPY